MTHASTTRPRRGPFRRLRDRLTARAVRSAEPAGPVRLVAIIPAHNEADCIADCLDGLLAQTVVPDLIVVAADNCDDDTAEIAAAYGGRVVVYETVDNTERKVGALSQAWLHYGADAEMMLGVDADTILEPTCVEDLVAEMEANPAAGGVMARYTFDQNLGDGLLASYLVRMQRNEFASWTMDLLRNNRQTYVLGGQATLFRGEAMREVTERYRRRAPWTSETQVEDMELTWRLNDLGWQTLCSPTARAYVGPMTTIRSFWAQRRKWDEGMIRLLLRDGFTKYTMTPWRQQAKMGLDAAIRMLFAVLLAISLSRGAYVWFWVWAIPPALAVILNLRIAAKMPNRTAGDMVTAALLIPAEGYLVLRLAGWMVAWWSVIFGIRRDGWSAQYRAEGKGGRK